MDKAGLTPTDSNSFANFDRDIISLVGIYPTTILRSQDTNILLPLYLKPYRTMVSALVGSLPLWHSLYDFAGKFLIAPNDRRTDRQTYSTAKP